MALANYRTKQKGPFSKAAEDCAVLRTAFGTSSELYQISFWSILSEFWSVLNVKSANHDHHVEQKVRFGSHPEQKVRFEKCGTMVDLQVRTCLHSPKIYMCKKKTVRNDLGTSSE